MLTLRAMSAGNNSLVSPPLTILCLASYEKGRRFLQEASRQGCRVFLLTSESLKETAHWPVDCLEDIFYMPDQDHEWNLREMLLAVCHLCRTRQIDRVVALDDCDLEKAAMLREHLRIPGLGESATRYFRDKLAMRICAAENGIPVPEFTSTVNYERISRFLETAGPPWVLKPRLRAGAIGIRKFHHQQDVWDRIQHIGDQQPFCLLEKFVPGDIFQVDSIWSRGEPAYTVASAYGTTPLEVSHDGGIFTTRILERNSGIARGLLWLNERVLRTFRMTDGVSHTEFIRAHEDGSLYFLETSARVGGAHISDLIETATGINMWEEWAKVEIASACQQTYAPPKIRNDYAGLMVSLAREEWPDASGFCDAEVAWRMKKRHHIGLIVKSGNYERVGELLTEYTDRVRHDFHASAPSRSSP